MHRSYGYLSLFQSIMGDDGLGVIRTGVERANKKKSESWRTPRSREGIPVSARRGLREHKNIRISIAHYPCLYHGTPV